MPPGIDGEAGPVARRIRCAARAFRWYARGLAGTPRTVLAELNWRLGDEIMALPVLEALHEKYPNDALDVRSHYPDLFEGFAAVRQVNPPACKPDRYLLLRGASRRVYRPLAYSQNAGVPLPARRPRLRFSDWEAPQLHQLPGGAGPLVALATGASWKSKRWLQERWLDLAVRLEAAGCRTIVLGQSGEEIGRGTDFTGRTTVRQAACLLHASDVLVCCDSGLMHLALAAGAPVVALFGPTDPAILIRDDPNFTAIRSTQSCSGFWNHADTVGEPGECPERHACCLDSIAVDSVYEAVQHRLETRSRSAR